MRMCVVMVIMVVVGVELGGRGGLVKLGRVRCGGRVLMESWMGTAAGKGVVGKGRRVRRWCDGRARLVGDMGDRCGGGHSRDGGVDGGGRLERDYRRAC